MVAIIIENGAIQEVLSDSPGEAVVIDLNVESTSKGRLSSAWLPDGEKVIAHVEGLQMTLNPIFISALKSRLSAAQP